MPRRGKLDFEKVKASLFTQCPGCGHKITPEEMRRVDFDRVVCPHCGLIFTPKKNQE